jgi:hypothetical protein
MGCNTMLIGANVLEEPAASIFYHEDGGSRFVTDILLLI